MDNKLLKAKIEIMTKSTFLSTIALSIPHKVSEDIPTAGTNGKEVLYNPVFCANLSAREMAGLMAHECWHVAFQHMSRRLDRDIVIWNKAGDYIINNMLLENNFVIPAGGLVNPAYRDMSTDEVYKLLIETGEDSTEYDGQDLIEGSKADKDGVDIRTILVKAHTQSKLTGRSEIPLELDRLIDELVNPKLPWNTLLARFLNNRAKDEYSWSRRNRRHRHVYLPSLYSISLQKLTFAIDTSGSVSKEDLTKMLSEIKAIKDTLNPTEMTIIDCDSEIHHIHEITPYTDILDLEFSGRGGTRFRPVLEYVDRHKSPLIYFTDLYGEKDLTPPDYPLMWICSSQHPPSNIGETIYLE